jgi:DNA polymerase-1
MKLDPDNRLRCSFNPVGTTSGRLSSSKTLFGTGGNTQNLPDEMKKYIVADDGYMLFSVDLSQAENRVVAYIAPEPTMIEAFETGKDVHKLTGALIHRVPITEVTDEQRSIGKRANHGLNYDFGYKSAAILWEITEAESKFIVDRYHSVYPGVRQYHAWVRDALSRNRTLTTPFGRSRRFMGRWGDELFKEAYSFIPQSTVADKLNRDGLMFLYYNQEYFKAVELLNQVHDSVVFQIPIGAGLSYATEVLLCLKTSLEKPIKWRSTEFSIPVDISVGTNLLSEKSGGDMKGIPADECTSYERLYKYLHGLYGAYRTAKTVSFMDSDIHCSGRVAEEVCAPVGNPAVLS